MGTQISHKKFGFTPVGDPMSNFKSKTMKKISLLLLVLLANFSLDSCTEENLAEVTNSTPYDQYATEEEHIVPEEE